MPEHIRIRIGKGRKVHLGRISGEMVYTLCSGGLSLGLDASPTDLEEPLCKSCIREREKWERYRKANA